MNYTTTKRNILDLFDMPEEEYKQLKRWTIPRYCAVMALEKVFGAEEFRKLNNSIQEEFIDFVTDEFRRIHCVVLYRSSERFMELCEKHNCDVGSREVIIKDNKKIYFSPHFYQVPSEV